MAKKAVQPSEEPSDTLTDSKGRRIVPQPHGGYLVPGAGGGDNGGGTPPSAVRAALREAFVDRVPLLTAIADDDEAPLRERLKAVSIMGDYSDIKPKGGYNEDDVRSRLQLTLHLIRQELPEDEAEALVARLRGVWT